MFFTAEVLNQRKSHTFPKESIYQLRVNNFTWMTAVIEQAVSFETTLPGQTQLSAKQ